MATSTGQNLGDVFGGREVRTVVDEDNIVSSAIVDFNLNQARRLRVRAGTFIRGEGDTFTIYFTGSDVCTVDDGNFTRSTISMNSAEIDPITGDIFNSKAVDLTVAVSGVLTAGCRANAPIRSAVGGWLLGENGRSSAFTQFYVVSNLFAILLYFVSKKIQFIKTMRRFISNSCLIHALKNTNSATSSCDCALKRPVGL